MLIRELLGLVNNKELVEAKDQTNILLSSKIEEALLELYKEYALDLFETHKKGHNDKKAPVTDKDNDSEDDSGDTLDPVGKGDDDIDNDGDSDKTDKYLKNRRKVISKAIKKEDREIPEIIKVVIEVAQKKAKKTYGVNPVGYASKSPEQKSRTQQIYYKKKERDARDKEKERKETEREKESRARERRSQAGAETR